MITLIKRLKFLLEQLVKSKMMWFKNKYFLSQLIIMSYKTRKKANERCLLSDAVKTVLDDYTLKLFLTKFTLVKLIICKAHWRTHLCKNCGKVFHCSGLWHEQYIQGIKSLIKTVILVLDCISLLNFKPSGCQNWC